MPDIKLLSADWQIQNPRATRGASARGAQETLSELPAAYLAAGAEIAETFVAETRPTTRGGAASAGSLDFSYDATPDAVAIVAVRHASGALSFHAPAESARATRGAPRALRFTIPIPTDPEAATTRGIISKIVKVMVVKIVDATIDKLVSIALPKVARLYETATWKKKGLQEGWLKVTKSTLAAGKLVPGKPSSTERSLLLIHGTFSNAVGAYRGLAAPGSDFFEHAATLYGDRIFAFDHFSLSRSPEENAKLLLDALPNKAFTFDVITHSRGGLVLRSLVERASVFGALSKRFQLHHAVLVASPNEGTPLATVERWKDTVGFMANVLEMFPDNPFTTGAEFVANGLVWLARHASGDLPGLHAMDGNSTFISALQAASPKHRATAAQYSALVSNYEPTGQTLKRLVDAGLDRFFASANDLVVPSEGGWRVDSTGTPWISSARVGCYGPGGNIGGDDVSHVGFFTRPETITFLKRALSGQPQQLSLVDVAKPLPDRPAARSALAGPPGVRRPPRAGKRAAKIRQAPAAVTDGASVEVMIVNGDLTFEPHPLIIGHYRASRLTGAERVVNDMIGGEMKRSLDAGVYPDAVGSFHTFINTYRRDDRPWQAPRPKAVVVVGLGEEGELKANDLSFTVRQGVLAWAQREAEAQRTGGVAGLLELSATLIGSGGSGITVGQAAQQIVSAVVSANKVIDEANKGRADTARHWPRVNRFRLIELYMDRANEAWQALNMLDRATPGQFVLRAPIAVGTGPLARPLGSGYRGADYDFISALTRSHANGGESIEYAIDSARARTEVRAQSAQIGALRKLVAAASSDGAVDERISRTLFQLLVPVEMEAFLGGTADLQLELDAGTAAIPWELLEDDARGPTSDVPWAIRTKLLRKLRTVEFREHVVNASSNVAVLVIGEPECPPEYPRLYGAQEEANAVVACFAGFPSADVKGLIREETAAAGPGALDVLNTVFEQPWRVIHVSGHGALADKESAGGVVLADGTFLGPYEIKMMRQVPDLVFINCCHLGAFANAGVLRVNTVGSYNRAQFASSVAEELIKIGVRCVVAAGWAVDDGAAAEFARTFYTSLSAGNRFIDAVALARKAAHTFDGNTWAAYQCYGDPDWRLVRDDVRPTGSASRSAEFDAVASLDELRLALDTILVQTKFQGRDAASQRERIDVLEKRWEKMRWGTAHGIGARFAMACAEVGDMPSAIGWYDRTIATTDGKVSFAELEQRENLRVREAWHAVDRARRARKGVAAATIAARATIRDAMALFARLRTFDDTSERASLCGSALKRLAMIEAVAERPTAEADAIGTMMVEYQGALAIAERKKSPDVFYPEANCIAAELALHPGKRSWTRLAKRFKRTEHALKLKNASDPDFWSMVGEIELKLYESVAHGTLSRSAKGIVESYRDFFARARGHRGWSSVGDTTDFVLSRYIRHSSAKESKAAQSVLDALEDIRAKVTGAQPAP